MTKNTISTLNGQQDIIIPACGPGWANIKVAFNSPIKRHRWGCVSVQRKINLENFTLAEGELDKTHPGTMSFEDYMNCILAYKDEILDLVERMNQ